MANSNYRIKEYETVHHLVSRIAHRVYFLKEEERNDFVEMMRRTADFCGVKLIGWCIMTNHFHILAYLPHRVALDEKEVIRRYAVLKGVSAATEKEKQFLEWRQSGAPGEQRVNKELDRIKARMYNIGSFMKILKQWFTGEYNRRYSHKGTLWESAYYDRIVEFVESEIAKCLGYIHLNPIRAAVAVRYSEYIWSSYTAFCRGDQTAIDGLKFAYGEDVPVETIKQRHEFLLDTLLENEKRRRAEDIARKRSAGYEIPPDALTDEAMIIQAAAHLEKVREASLALKEEAIVKNRRKRKLALAEEQVVSLRQNNPDITVTEIASTIGMSERSVYRIIARLNK